MSKQLLEHASRLRYLAGQCEDLANHGQLAASDREPLRTTAAACRELAAELEAAALAKD